MAAPLPPAPDCQYAACYCEENVYQLCGRLEAEGPDHLARASAVFISNLDRTVPLWSQKAGRGADRMVVWDYHVILLYRAETGTLVYDLDTCLAFPVPFSTYCRATFRSDTELEPRFHRVLRAVPAAAYLAQLSSDRRHMRRGEGWAEEPPAWPCIRGPGAGGPHSLDSFIHMEEGTGPGQVLTLEAFLGTFG